MFVRMEKKSKKVRISLILLSFFWAVTLVIATPLSVQAADGWWIDSESVGSEIYNQEENSVSFSEMDWSELQVGTPNAFEAILGDIIYWIGKGIDALLSFGGDLKLDIDNVVLGRMGPDSGDISFMQFGLEYGNPWGILGARIFVSLRDVTYGALLLYVLFFLIWQLVKGGGAKGRAEAKELVQNAFFALIMLYVFVFLFQAILYFRDVCLYLTMQGIDGGTGTTSGLLDTFENLFQTNKSILNAIIYLATVFAGFWFLSNYVGIALIQTGLFGTAPIVMLRSIKNKRLFSQWLNTLISNASVPAIDAALILIPSVLGKILNDVAGVGEYNITFMLLRLFIIFSIIPARNGILRAISDAAGGGLLPAGGGMGALGALAMRAAMRRGGGMLGGENGKGGIKNEALSPEDDLSEANMLQENGQRIAEAERNLGQQIPDIDQLFADSGQQSAFDQFNASDDALSSLVGDFPTEASDESFYENDLSETMQEGTMAYSGGMGEASMTGGVSDIDSMLSNNDLYNDGTALNDTSLEYTAPTMDAGGVTDINGLMTKTGAADETGTAMAAGSSAELMQAGTAYDGGGTLREMGTQSESNTLYGHTGSDELSSDVTDRDAAAADRYQNLKNIETCQAYMDSNEKKIQALSLQESNIDSQLSDVSQSTIDRVGSQIGRLEGAKSDFAKDKYQASLDYDSAKQSGRAAQNAIDKHNSGERVLSKKALNDVREQKVASDKTMNDARYRMDQADARIKDADTQISQIKRTAAGKAYDLSTQKSAIQQQRQQLTAQNSTIKQSQNVYKNYEKEYAAFDKAKGGSGQTFSSSQAFKQTAESNARRAKLANVLNFDSSKFNGVLTPEERAERLRQRAVNRQQEADRARIKQSAMNVAKVAGAAVGAVAGMYGGASNMVYTGMMGAEATTIPGKLKNIYVAAGETDAAIGREINRTGASIHHVHEQIRDFHASDQSPYTQNTYSHEEQTAPLYSQTEEALRAKEHLRNNMRQE